MSNEPGSENYHDPAMTRARWELRAILIIVVLVIAGGLAWRLLAGRPSAPETAWRPAPNAKTATPLAAAAGVAPGTATPLKPATPSAPAP